MSILSSLTRSNERRVQPGVDPNEPLVRGLALLAALAFVRDRGGRALMMEVLSRLTEDEVVTLVGAGEAADGGDTDAHGEIGKRSRQRSLHPRGWYPLSLQCNLLTAIDATIGNGDLSALHEVGFAMAQRDIRRVFRPFMRVGNPGWIIELAPRLWRTYQSHGTWEFERTPVSLIATLKGRLCTDPSWCVMFEGWMEAALEMSGAIEVVGSHPACTGHGAQHCVYTVRWEVAS